ncbi:PQ-loop repeat family protein / transmembrane family protein [Quillaja saponaria]|uniref:PQ-loop repeat family protein / transmembrane family protein n=1 Tax=Quillaja saponaria TaxID=32244 RepID=A0AAD7L7N6_QUISA|nr:PQ-loop repeat family protein / transmembrane family protein [Quillaja saponaria]
MAPSYCVKEMKPCVGWVQKYFKDCLCNLKDDFSFGFGLISLVCWGVAEIPQIITNFRTKSSHGVSLTFLLTWVAGDVFNLLGCLLEPATLPTQFYTALLYTISTVILVLQSLYYDYTCKWWKCRNMTVNSEAGEEKTPLRPKSTHGSGIPVPKSTPKATPRRDFYYTSARSLAGSGTPPFRTYMRVTKSGPSAMELNDDSSSEDEAGPVSSNTYMTQPRPIPRSAGYGTFLAASVNLPLKSDALAQAYVRFTGRKLLQEHRTENVYGQWLGWLMAAIYMGGRLPQIWLNIKRGSVEGLNPLMFIFALVANATYLASILVRSSEWESIKANMPWLLDAAVCVALDLFIILQYVYYRYLRRALNEDRYGEYVETSKGVLY